jgi:hypothetical protein
MLLFVSWCSIRVESDAASEIEKIYERLYLECIIPDLNQFTLRTTHVRGVWVGYSLPPSPKISF